MKWRRVTTCGKIVASNFQMVKDKLKSVYAYLWTEYVNITYTEENTTCGVTMFCIHLIVQGYYGSFLLQNTRVK